MLVAALIFQSTLPTRGSDEAIDAQAAQESKISIHAPHEGERLPRAVVYTRRSFISIHAPHEGERRYETYGDCPDCYISIHAPHEGERLYPAVISKDFFTFQSTLPTRGSDDRRKDKLRGQKISIHAPHEGERRFRRASWARSAYFNPRSPRGGATSLLCRTNDRI